MLLCYLSAQLKISRFLIFRTMSFLHVDSAITFFAIDFRVQLSADQNRILDFAFEGHNLLITGQAGVGLAKARS